MSGVSPLVGATYFRLGIAALLLFLTIVPVAANDTVTVDAIYVGW